MFLSWRLARSGGGGRGVCRRGRGPMPRVSAYPPEKSHAIRLDEVSIKSEKRCNSNDLNSRFEIVLGELHAKLRVGSGMWEVGAGCEGRGPSRGLAWEGSEVGWARLRCPWAVAGPGCGAGGWRQGQGGPRNRPLRAVRLACGDLAGGPPPTGTQSDQTELGRSCAVDGGRAERSSRRGR